MNWGVLQLTGMIGAVAVGAATTIQGMNPNEYNGAQIPSPGIGVVNPLVTQANIHQTICVSGWTATVRPSVDWSEGIKRRLMRMFYPIGYLIGWFELDHYLPIEVGGAPKDVHNLWLQPWYTHIPGSKMLEWGAHIKDELEDATKRDICSGKITLAQGQARFLGTDWRVSYIKVFGNPPSN